MKVNNYFKIIFILLNMLIIVSIIVAPIIGAGNVLIGLAPFIIFGAFQIFAYFCISYTNGKHKYFVFLTLSLIKTVSMIIIEVFFDFGMNGFTYAKNGAEYVMVLTYLSFVTLLLMAELAYVTVNLVLIYKTK